MDDHTDDGLVGAGLDGSGLVRAFESAKQRALSEPQDEAPRDRAEWVLEAMAYLAAVDAIGRLSSVPRADREALASRARRTLLALGGLTGDDEDAREALDVAARYAREGLRALASPSAEVAAGDDPPPPVRDLVRFLRGELDGFASADVALRARRSSRARAELARVVPSVMAPSASRFRVAADSLDESALRVRDPRDGTAVGAVAIEDAAFEAFAFADGTLAIYADPPLLLRVSGVGIAATRAVGAGYVELTLAERASALTLRVEHGDRSFEWVLALDHSPA